MDELIKSMQMEMVEKEKEFNSVREELRILEENYMVKRKQLTDSIEQIRGAYTALYMQLNKFGQIKEKATPDNTTNNETNSEDFIVENKDVAKIQENTTTKKTSNKKESKKDKVVTGLTPEEIEKINKAIPQKDKVDNNGNEIPEYLQTEYNK